MKAYYPGGYNPIHAVRSWVYVRKIIRAVKRGEKITPILVDGSYGNGNLLAGTHRLAANDIMDLLDLDCPRIEVIDINNIDAPQELLDAVAASDYEAIDDMWDRHCWRHGRPNA